jgi:hypothetical protein
VVVARGVVGVAGELASNPRHHATPIATKTDPAISNLLWGRIKFRFEASTRDERDAEACAVTPQKLGK